MSDWSSDVCSSDLGARGGHGIGRSLEIRILPVRRGPGSLSAEKRGFRGVAARGPRRKTPRQAGASVSIEPGGRARSEEHTSELQSLMRISYAVFCLKQNKKHTPNSYNNRKPN